MAGKRRCWVIVDGANPTAFYAREAEDLVPTLKQLQRTQPQVTLMWYERGRFWPSPEAARQALRERGDQRGSGRGRDWRPGGEHRDPKARPDVPRDVKRARFKRRMIAGGTKSADGQTSAPPPADRRPKPDWSARSRPPGGGHAPRSRPDGPGGDGGRQGRGSDRPKHDGPSRWKDRERDPRGRDHRSGEPGSDRPREGQWKPRPPDRPREERARDDWRGKKPGPGKPGGSSRPGGARQPPDRKRRNPK